MSLTRELIVGRPVVIAVDPQQGGSQPGGGIPATMTGRAQRAARMVRIVERSRELGVPVVFIQEVHKRSMIDIGRELDGAEGPHCVEDDPANGFIDGIEPRPEEFHSGRDPVPPARCPGHDRRPPGGARAQHRLNLRSHPCAQLARRDVRLVGDRRG